MTYINGDLIVKEATIANALMIFSTMSSILSTHSISFSVLKSIYLLSVQKIRFSFAYQFALVAVNVGGFCGK